MGLRRAQPLCLVEGQRSEELAFPVSEVHDTVVEAGDRHARVVVVQGGDQAGGGGGRVGHGAAEGAGVDVLLGAVQPDLALGEAAHTGAHGGGVLGPHAGVGHDHRVGGEPVRVLFDERTEVRGAGFLLALDQQLQVDGRGGAAGGGQVGAHAEGVEEDLALVVGRTARVEAVVADDGLEGVAVPAVLTGGGLHVVMAVDQHGGRSRVGGGPLGVDVGCARGVPDLGGGKAGLLEFRGEPVGAAAHMGSVVGPGRDGRDAQPLGEIVEEGDAVLCDVRTDGADGTVNGLAHAVEPSGPRGCPRSAVSHRTVPPAAAVPSPRGRAGCPGGPLPRCARTGTRP